MSLYFDECVEEEKSVADSEKDMIKFYIPWVLPIPPNPNTFESAEIIRNASFKTTYNVFSAKWNLSLSNNYIKLDPGSRDWDERCHLSYKLYNELGSELYSSDRIFLQHDAEMDSLSLSLCTPAGEMKPFLDALIQRKLAKMVFLIEIQISIKFFFHPHETFWADIKPCLDYPEDIDSDFRFDFLKDGDFTFNCPDGNVPALKMVINVTPLKKYLNGSKNDEFILDHLADVVKPIIIYMHSECFEMPTTYNLEFADRLLKALKFFELEYEDGVERRIQLSLYQKFVTDPLDFELILEWISFDLRHSFDSLNQMVAATIAQKYYYQWLQRFPENTRTTENQMLENIFGSTDQALWFFLKLKKFFSGHF